MHIVGIAPRSPSWGFNGDYDKPTFTPSVLVSGVKTTKDADGEWDGGWERDAAGNTIPEVCHSFVTDGKIQFLGDSTHELSGQTVELRAKPDREA